MLEKSIKTSNPSFTVYSFRRTIEMIVLKAEGLFFMEIVSDERITEVIKAIPAEWKIEDRIRDLEGDLC